MQDKTSLKKIKGIYAKVDVLLEQTEIFGNSAKSIGSLEQGLLSGLLDLGLSLLKIGIENRKSEVESKRILTTDIKIINKGEQSRVYQSIFGVLEFYRQKYHLLEKGVYYPLDEALEMPSEKMSYLLQSWVSKNSTELDYRESVSMLNEVLGLNLNGTQSKKHSNDLSKEVDEFYEKKDIIPVAPASYICLEWDGKGVPIVKEERIDAEKEVATSVGARLKRGQKRGIKKSATVGVFSDFQARKRTKEQIVGGLFKSPLSPLNKEKKTLVSSLESDLSKKGNWHNNIHRRAFFGQSQSIRYGVDFVKKRCEGKNIPLVVLVDGGKGLEENILASLKSNDMDKQLAHMILDIVHVSEYVWKSANAILGENSFLRTSWVKDVLFDILDSKVDKVISDLEANLEKTQLSQNKQVLLKKTITYFTNHKHKMDYKTYLDKGLPVSTALVESSCGHLIKDRMERSGMRWSLQGAQNMMNLRAVKKNDDWSEFMEFAILKKNRTLNKLVA